MLSTRNTVLALTITPAAIAAAFLGGCFGEPTTTYKGRQVTESQLPELVERDIAKAEADAKAKAEAAAAAAAAETARIAREAADRQHAFERQLSRLQSEQQFAVEDMTDLFAGDIANLDQARREAQEKAAAAIAQSQKDLAAFTADAEAARAAAQAEIDRKWNIRETIGQVLAPAADAGASFVPGLGAVLATLGGGTGLVGLLGLSRANRRKLEVNEALRAALAAAHMLPDDMQAAFQRALTTQADDQDQAVIAGVVKADSLKEQPKLALAA